LPLDDIFASYSLLFLNIQAICLPVNLSTLPSTYPVFTSNSFMRQLVNSLTCQLVALSNTPAL